MTLRHLLVATHVPPSGAGGGMVRYATELARALAERPDVELHVAVAEGAEPAFREWLDGSRVWPVPGSSVHARSLHELAGRFGAVLEAADVVHGTKHILPVRGWPRSRRPLLALTVHDLFLLDRPGDYPAAKRLLAPVYRASMRRADVLLANSDATRERVATRFPDLAARTTSVPLAVASALRTAAPVPVDAVAALGDRPVAVVVGDTSRRKNLPVVFAAWARVAQEVPGAVLVHVGPPRWSAENLGAHYGDLVDSGALLALGHVPDAELAWLYRRAQVCLCPSRIEGFGLPAAEAVHFGTPLLRTADAALGEAAAGTGVVLPPDDPAAWSRAIVDQLRGRGLSGAPTVPTRTWADVAAETVSAVRARLGVAAA